MRWLMLAVIASMLLITCDTNSDNITYAKEGKYYFEIMEKYSDTTDQYLKVALTQLLPQKKYAITSSAGLNWPFFETYSINERVHRSELMPPHTITHTFISIDHNRSISQNGDAKLTITLNNENGEHSFDMIIYHWKDSNWVQTVNTGNHEVSANKYKTREELIDILYKTIVRYSFK